MHNCSEICREQWYSKKSDNTYKRTIIRKGYICRIQWPSGSCYLKGARCFAAIKITRKILTFFCLENVEILAQHTFYDFIKQNNNLCRKIIYLHKYLQTRQGEIVIGQKLSSDREAGRTERTRDNDTTFYYYTISYFWLLPEWVWVWHLQRCMSAVCSDSRLQYFCLHVAQYLPRGNRQHDSGQSLDIIETHYPPNYWGWWVSEGGETLGWEIVTRKS